MSLPNLPAGDKLRREVRTEWGGLNLNENAGDGELIEAMNMSSREYPLLATAAKPVRYVNQSTEMAAPVMYGDLYWIEREDNDCFVVYKTASPKHDASRKISTLQTHKLRYAPMQKKIFMVPNKQYYDVDSNTVKGMEQTASPTTLNFLSVTVDGVPGTANCITDPNMTPGDAWPFEEGDAVTISGCTKYPENNKTVIVRGVEDANLYVDDYALKLANKFTYNVTSNDLAGVYGLLLGDVGDTPYRYAKFTATATITAGSTIVYVEPESTVTITPSGGTAYTYAAEITESSTGMSNIYTPSSVEEVDYSESGTITVTREVPDMDFICVNENRLWGCKGDTIYASALGNPMNFNVFNGLSTDSWAAETGTPGNFTGCTTFQGYPVFFKQNAVFRVYGDIPSNFTLRKQNIAGVADGCDLSLVEVRGCLYYQSPVGIMAWSGGDYPSLISAPLDLDFLEIVSSVGTPRKRWWDGIAGTDGNRYYIDIIRYDPSGSAHHLYVYDTRFGTWHELTGSVGSGRVRFAWDGVDYYMIRSYMNGNNVNYEALMLPGEETPSTEQPWAVTFADSTRAYKTALTGSEAKKGVLRLLIRCKLAGTMKVWIAYDGGDFEEALTLGGEDGLGKTTRVVPLILRRCDFWQMKLTGTKEAVIYSIAVERYGGEWQQA